RRDFLIAPLAFAERLPEGQLQLLPPLPNRVVTLEAEADRVHEVVTAGAGLGGGVDGEPGAIGPRRRLAHGRQVRVDARWRVRHMLTEKLFANEQPAGGRRGVVGLGSERKE